MLLNFSNLVLPQKGSYNSSPYNLYIMVVKEALTDQLVFQRMLLLYNYLKNETL